MTETTPPLRLPQIDAATIPSTKLTGYALNPDHETGRDKARVFRSALGIGKGDWRYLRDQILKRLRKGEVLRVEPRSGGFEWTISVRIDGLNGASAPVTTRWVVQADQPPRLSTLWVDI